MDNKKIFFADEAVSNPGKYMIGMNHELFNLKSTTGSYNVICARLLNLSYAQYLRFCRDMCKGEIIGKNTMFPVVYFQQGAMLDQLITLLNNRAHLVLWENEHPDWKEHQEYLKQLDLSRKGV